jgi:hypothetical protein
LSINFAGWFCFETASLLPDTGVIYINRGVTVHWVVTVENAKSPQEVIGKASAWNKRALSGLNHEEVSHEALTIRAEHSAAANAPRARSTVLRLLKRRKLLLWLLILRLIHAMCESFTSDFAAAAKHVSFE